MVLDRINSLQSGDVDDPTKTTTISRRRALQVGLITVGSLAGCLNTESSTDPNNGSGNGSDSDELDERTTDNDTEEQAVDNDAETEEEEGSSLDDNPENVVYEFLEAAVEEDLEQMSELSHSRNPLDPAAWVEDGWEFRGGGDEEDLEGLNAEVIDDDLTVEDIFELEGAAFWFEADELTDTLEGEAIVSIAVTVDDPTEDETVWILATEDGEWRYLFAASIDDTPDDPEEVFEEPIEDENDDVVVEIDWEYDSQTSDIPQAAVVLTDERGIDVNRIEIESTIEGASTGAFDRDDDEFTATWEDVTLYIAYNTDGDQIIVTAINEDENESEIVHREHYLP